MGGFEWLWKEHRPKPIEMEHSVTNKDRVFINNKLKIQLEIDVKSPASEDVAKVLKNSQVDFLLPPDCTIKAVKLLKVEFLGRGGEW